MGERWPYTHRVILTQEAWEAEQWNRPDRRDYYIIQLTTIVSSLIHGLAGSRDTPSIDDYILEFGDGRSKEGRGSGEINTEEELATSMMTWMVRTGLPAEQIKKNLEMAIPGRKSKQSNDIFPPGDDLRLVEFDD